jgi:hypothetical protein
MWGGKTVELAIHSCYSQLARSWLYTAAIHSWLGAGYTQLLFTAGQELAIHSYYTQLRYTATIHIFQFICEYGAPVITRYPQAAGQ